MVIDDTLAHTDDALDENCDSERAPSKDVKYEEKNR